MLRSGDYVVPHFLGQPFLEKPPFYYAALALVIKVNGINERFPTVARLLSVACGWIILACTFSIAADALSPDAGIIAVLLTLQMPAFWKYSHTVLLDIALAAATTVFMTCYYFLCLRGVSYRPKLLQVAAGLAVAIAVLTKSIVPIAILAPVLALQAHAVGKQHLRALCSLYFIVTAVVPISIWIVLLFRAGGVVYLHAHFVANILGRLLHRHFMTAGLRSDLGRNESWSFYLKTLPEVYGLCVIALPCAVWGFLRHRPALTSSKKSSVVFFALWAVVPIALLSIPSSKERSYLLPALPGMALFCAAWIESAFQSTQGVQRRKSDLWPATLVLAGGVGLVEYLGEYASISSICGIGFFALGAICLLLFSRRGWPSGGVEMACAAITSAMVLMYAPGVQRRDQINRTFTAFVPMVWNAVGDRPLFLYQTGEGLGGSVTFEADRDAQAIGIAEMATVLQSEDSYCLIPRDLFGSLLANPRLRALFTVVFDRQVTPSDGFVLIRSAVRAKG